LKRHLLQKKRGEKVQVRRIFVVIVIPFKSFSIHNLVVEQLIHHFKLYIFIQIIKSFLNNDSLRQTENCYLEIVDQLNNKSTIL
jgi:hypothetical protein